MSGGTGVRGDEFDNVLYRPAMIHDLNLTSHVVSLPDRLILAVMRPLRGSTRRSMQRAPAEDRRYTPLWPITANAGCWTVLTAKFALTHFALQTSSEHRHQHGRIRWVVSHVVHTCADFQTHWKLRLRLTPSRTTVSCPSSSPFTMNLARMFN